MSGEASVVYPDAARARIWPTEGARFAGSLIVAGSAIAFSTAGLFTRLIAADVWTMLFWRGVFGGLFIAAYIVWRQRAASWAALSAIGRAGLLVASCSTIATICFVTALRQTTVADVTIIYATAPFLAAAIAFVWTRERPSRATLGASVVALAGVVVMCGSALSGGHSLGDLLALGMTALMALMMVVIRKHRHVSMLPAACLSAFACTVAVVPLAHPASVMTEDLVLLGLFGTTQFGLGLLLLTIGSRLISATRASLLANLELPLAPLWVWLAFGEIPSEPTYIGGALVCVAVVLDLVADQLRPHQTC